MKKKRKKNKKESTNKKSFVSFLEKKKIIIKKIKSFLTEKTHQIIISTDFSDNFYYFLFKFNSFYLIGNIFFI